MFKQFYFNEADDESAFRIFVDLDSVLTDWNAAFEKIAHIPATQYELKYGQTDMWKLINGVGVDFWALMPWMPDGKKLWEFIKPYNPTILTKPTRSSGGRKECIEGKKKWLDRELPNVPYLIEDVKEKYSGRNKILIDDLKENCTRWTAVGGISIKHINTEDTIRQLTNVLESDKLGANK